MKRLISLVVDPFVFAFGFLAFAVTKHTPRIASGSLRRLFVATDGRFNDFAGRISARVHPPVRLGGANGVLGDLDERAIDALARSIERKGYHVFEARLDDGVCQKIVEFAKRTPATLIPARVGGPTQSIYDPEAPLAPRYQFEERRIFELPELQELATDETFMAVAQAYLGCRPVNDLVAVWWSPAFGNQASSEAAQLFHFDMDRLKFVKFFVYLTDVDVRRGPHVYVASSHVRKPEAVRRDGRIPDEEIIRAYGQEGIIEITGQRGTVLAVDTRGFHKGKGPESGDRLLFQVEYTNSLFGAPYNRIASDGTWSERALAQLQRNPAVFQRFERPVSV